MKAAVFLSLTAWLLLPGASSALGANVPYFPYDTIEKYYQPDQQPPPPPEPARPQAPVQPNLKAPQRPGQPTPVTQPPEFLFPPDLKFGVAVGVPYDMMFISGTYYYWQGGTWYRATSYRGPWERLVASQIPPELDKRPLAQIRKLRNAEYQKEWKEKEKYQGKRFRPGGGMKGEEDKAAD